MIDIIVSFILGVVTGFFVTVFIISAYAAGLKRREEKDKEQL